VLWREWFGEAECSGDIFGPRGTDLCDYFLAAHHEIQQRMETGETAASLVIPPVYGRSEIISHIIRNQIMHSFLNAYHSLQIAFASRSMSCRHHLAMARARMMRVSRRSCRFSGGCVIHIVGIHIFTMLKSKIDFKFVCRAEKGN
jgi:hypothetical protein